MHTSENNLMRGIVQLMQAGYWENRTTGDAEAGWNRSSMEMRRR